jgi:hypothetical protein
MVDNISISANGNDSNDSILISEWAFPEGEGSQTTDGMTSDRQGSIVWSRLGYAGWKHRRSGS